MDRQKLVFISIRFVHLLRKSNNFRVYSLHFFLFISLGKTSIAPSTKRNASPIDFEDEIKRGRSSNERRRSLDSISSISSSSLDRSPISHGYEQKKSKDKDDDVIYVGSKSRSRSPRGRGNA